MNRQVALSTIDNPFSPFEDFSKWYLFDISESSLAIDYGFTGGCAEVLARIAVTSQSFSDEENETAIDEAIDTILESDFTKQYIKYVEGDKLPEFTKTIE